MSTHSPTPEVTDTRTRLTDDPAWLPISMVALIGALLLIATVIATEGIYLAAVEEDKQIKLYNVRNKLYDNQLQAQKAELADYQYVDEARGVVQIPVERAMDLFLKELSESKR